MSKRLVLLQRKGNTNPGEILRQWTSATREEMIEKFDREWQADDDSDIRLIQYGEFVPPIEESTSVLEFLMDRVDEDRFETSVVNALIGAMIMLTSDEGSLSDSRIKEIEESLDDPDSGIDLNRFQPEVQDYINRALNIRRRAR